MLHHLFSEKSMPTEDNAQRKTHDTGTDTGIGSKSDKLDILAGLNGPFGIDGTPMISPQLTLGASYFSFSSNVMQLPKDLRDKITGNENVKKVSDDYENNGYGVVAGISKYACAFHIQSVMMYDGASLGGASIFGSDPHRTFISVIHGEQPYDITLKDGTKSQADAESLHFMFNIGGDNYSFGGSYVEHTARVSDSTVGNMQEFKVHIQVDDIEKWVAKDSDFSLGLAFQYSNLGDKTLKIDPGVIALKLNWDRGGKFSLSPFLQVGGAF